MNKNACPTCGCELSNASFAEDGILCMWCGTVNMIEGDPMPEADDFGPDPEDAAPAHLDGDPDEGQPCDDFYGDDAAFDEYRMDQGWDD